MALTRRRNLENRTEIRPEERGIGRGAVIVDEYGIVTRFRFDLNG